MLHVMMPVDLWHAIQNHTSGSAKNTFIRKCLGVMKSLCKKDVKVSIRLILPPH